MSWFLRALQKYGVFSGRARRAEYWYFILFYLIVVSALEIITLPLAGHGPNKLLTFLSAVVVFGLVLPGLAVTVRRLHDTDRSGWWFLITFIPVVGSVILLVFLIGKGTVGDNRYGPDPLTEPAAV